jgi:hypothetical protein
MMRKGISILVVDDAEGIRNYLKNLLTLKGYEVRCAEGGRQALESLNSDFVRGGQGAYDRGGYGHRCGGLPEQAL